MLSKKRLFLVTFVIEIVLSIAEPKPASLLSTASVLLPNLRNNVATSIGDSTIYCGIFEGSFSTNTSELIVLYTFIGRQDSLPIRFERKQTPLSCSFESAVDDISCLNLSIACTIMNFQEQVSFVVNTVTLQFNRREELDIFGCDNDTVIGEQIPLNSVSCSSPVFSFLDEFSSGTSTLLYHSYNQSILITDFLGTYQLTLLDHSSCSNSAINIVGAVLTFFLVVAFLFLLIFAYNNKKKSSFIGNGINVKDIHYISKPFSSTINPYSKKSKEIPRNPEPERPTRQVLEMNTITIQRGGTRSSFFIM